jgi:hypothetical protein
MLKSTRKVAIAVGLLVVAVMLYFIYWRRTDTVALATISSVSVDASGLITIVGTVPSTVTDASNWTLAAIKLKSIGKGTVPITSASISSGVVTVVTSALATYTSKTYTPDKSDSVRFEVRKVY